MSIAWWARQRRVHLVAGRLTGTNPPHGRDGRRALVPAVMVVLATFVGGLTAERSLGAFTATAQNASETFGTDALDPPTSLTATGGTTVTLSWTATTDAYATGYNLYQATSAGGPFTLIGQVTPRTTTSFIDSSSPATYYYHARAHYASWESAPSNQVFATITASAPSFDSSSSATGTAATQSWNHTVGSGSNRILIVTTSSMDRSANSVTFNGQSLTLIGRQNDGDGATRISMWYRVNPASGPGTIQVTYASGSGQKTMGATSWSNVDQVTPLGTFASQSGHSTTASVTVASGTDEVVVDAVSAEDVTSITVHPSQTQRWNATVSDTSGGHSSASGAASVTMSWTMQSAYWAIGAVSLRSP